MHERVYGCSTKSEKETKLGKELEKLCEKVGGIKEKGKWYNYIKISKFNIWKRINLLKYVDMFSMYCTI